MKKQRIPTYLIGFCCPMVAIIVLFPLYNRVEPYVLGFSFIFFWIFAWLFLTSFCLFLGYRLDPYNKAEGRERAERNMEKAIAMLEPEGGRKS